MKMTAFMLLAIIYTCILVIVSLSLYFLNKGRKVEASKQKCVDPSYYRKRKGLTRKREEKGKKEEEGEGKKE